MVEFTDNIISDFRIEIPVSAEAYILVEGPGYENWERVIKIDDAEYEEVVVELIPMNSRTLLIINFQNPKVLNKILNYNSIKLLNEMDSEV